VAARTNTILARMGEVTRDGLDWCVKPGSSWEDNNP
jgi:hypothetical protein